MTKKESTWFVWIVIVLILGAFYFIFIAEEPTLNREFSKTNTFSLIPQDPEPTVLDFCSSQQECIRFLESQGMPKNFLEENRFEITCSQNGICTIIKR